MAFKMTSSAIEPDTSVQPAPMATEVNAAAVEVVNAKEELERLEVALSQAVERTRDLPCDGELLDDYQGLQAALIGLSKHLGFEYAPIASSSYRFVVTDKGSKFLSGPCIIQAEKGVGIYAWGQTRELPLTESITGADWRLIQEDNRHVMIWKAGQYRLPISIRFNDEGRTEKAQKEFILLNSFGDLHKYLAPMGSSISKFSELDDGTDVVIKRLREVKTRKSGDGQYGVLDCELDGEEVQFFAPGDVSDWDGSDFYPLQVIKTGDFIKFLYNEQEAAFPLGGGGFTKLSELDEGKSYKVVSYSIKDGKFGDNVLICLDDGRRVNANAAIKRVLKTQLQAVNDGGEEHSIDATLEIDSTVTKAGRDGRMNTYVNLRFRINNDAAKALAARLGL